MFRRALHTGFRLIRRAFRDRFYPPSHSTSNVPTAVVSRTVHNQVQPLNVDRFLFAYWLKNASRVARSRCNPVQWIGRNRPNMSPLLFGFVGFTWLGLNNSETTGPSTYSPNENQLHQLLQDMLSSAADNIPKESANLDGKKLKDFKIGKRLGQNSCNSAVYEVTIDKRQFALKMLFNFSTDSQSSSLKKGFAKELAVLSSNTESLQGTSPYTNLPRHFNVMEVLGHFADDVQLFPDSKKSYPAVLPRALHHNGLGRNRTLYYLMPKFSTTLREFVARHKDSLDSKTSLALLAQVLEGLYHLNKHGVAHRDLKSDNVLVNQSTAGLPRAVITDLGECLAEQSIGLKMPYRTYETSKGGNVQLMAPEVYCAEPGPNKEVNYSKSDEWAAGALAYEMYGQDYPFQDETVDKGSYDVEDLPELKGVPVAVRCLVRELLHRHPNDRPNISVAATACQMILWRPKSFTNDCEQSGLAEEIKRWFVNKVRTLALEMLKYKREEDVAVEHQILLTFLRRTNVDEILSAVEWLHRKMAMK